MKIGLALGSGAARGIAHIGVIKALEEADIKVDYIAGSSMGALIGAAYASAMPIDEMEDIAVNTDWKAVAKLFLPTLSKSGIVKAKRIRKFLYSNLGDRNIEDLSIPFAATAVDISTGKLLVIKKGNIIEAILASTSIPVIFTPVKCQDSLLVDGGLINPVPIDIVKQMGADFVIASNVMSYPKNIEGTHIESNKGSTKRGACTSRSSNRETNFISKNQLSRQNLEDSFLRKGRNSADQLNSPGVKSILHRSVLITQREIAKLQINLYQPDLLIEPDTSFLNAYEFHRGKVAIEEGYQTAKKAIETIELF